MGQPYVVVMDEMRGSRLKFATLMSYLGGSAVTLNVKYSSTSLQATTFFVTSPKSPCRTYAADIAPGKECGTQLMRRVTYPLNFDALGYWDAATNTADAAKAAFLFDVCRDRPKADRRVQVLLTNHWDTTPEDVSWDWEMSERLQLPHCELAQAGPSGKRPFVP